MSGSPEFRTFPSGIPDISVRNSGQIADRPGIKVKVVDASEDEVSSEDSSLQEPEVSQLKTKRTEGTKTKRRTKPATSFVKVTLSFFNSCSFAYTDLNTYRRFQLKAVPGHG